MNSLREECPQLDTAVDYDGMSLVSYNSVAMQDGRPPPVTRNCTESRHYPYRFDVGEETATVSARIVTNNVHNNTVDNLVYRVQNEHQF